MGRGGELAKSDLHSLTSTVTGVRANRPFRPNDGERQGPLGLRKYQCDLTYVVRMKAVETAHTYRLCRVPVALAGTHYAELLYGWYVPTLLQ